MKEDTGILLNSINSSRKNTMRVEEIGLINRHAPKVFKSWGMSNIAAITVAYF